LKSTSLVLVAVIAVALVAGAYYASAQNSSNSSATSITVNIQIVGGVGAGTVDTYSPDNFTVTEGQHVTLVVLDSDDNTHGLIIPQFGVDTGIIQSGASVRVQFVANQAGNYTFYEPAGYCTGGFGNACNSIQKMSGTMTVLP